MIKQYASSHLICSADWIVDSLCQCIRNISYSSWSHLSWYRNLISKSSTHLCPVLSTLLKRFQLQWLMTTLRIMTTIDQGLSGYRSTKIAVNLSIVLRFQQHDGRDTTWPNSCLRWRWPWHATSYGLGGYVITWLYTVSGKKRGHVIFNYNSRIFWSIFIIFVPLETGVNTWQLYVIYFLKCLMTL